jgi:tetratricopeptide (TPR) repeat protein
MLFRLTVLLPMMLAAVAAGGGELEIAKEALRDGLWELAREHALKDAGDEAKIVVLESYAGEDRWDEIEKALDAWPECKAPAFEYYRAVCAGDYERALAILRQKGGVSEFADVKMFEAGIMNRAGKHDEARRLWREVLSSTNASERSFTLASVNLGDVDFLRQAYTRSKNIAMRRLAGLRLGTALLKLKDGMSEGARIITDIVRDAPDSQGARSAFLAIADQKMAAGEWREAADLYNRAIETWPEAARLSAVQEARGWAFQKLGRAEDALSAFERAAELADNDDARATATVKAADVLSELGRSEQAMAKYREVIERFPSTPVADRLKRLVELSELEARGRELYRSYRFAEASGVFAQIAAKDPARKPRMDFCEVLCLYGQGMDETACKKVEALAAECPDASVRAEAVLWMAKYDYNRSEWKRARKGFETYALTASPERAAMALLWASRAALADNDLDAAIKTATKIVELHPASSWVAPALIVQGEALIGEARFDEAVLVLERALMAGAEAADRVRAQMLKADALFAMGADNPSRYSAALEAYQAIKFAGALTPSENIVISFKIARALERLKRTAEAIDRYYTEVVLAYREGRLAGVYYDDAAKAAFSRSAFWLADEYEMRGMPLQAVSVLRLVVASDVPAAKEAQRRIERISMKGRNL